MVNILCACHALMIPFRPDEFSKKGLENFYILLEDIDAMGISNTPKVLAHIPNLVDNRRKQEMKELDAISTALSSEFGDNCVTKPFYNRIPLVKSISEKKSVYEFNSKDFHELHEQFNNLAERVITGV